MGADLSCEASTSTTNVSKASSANFVNDDRKLATALTTDCILFCVALALYMVFHQKRSKWYYTNPLRRGFGPSAPEPASAWEWLRILWRMPLDDFEAHAGSNARVFMEFLLVVLHLLWYHLPVAIVETIAILVASLALYPGGLLDEYGNDLGGLARLSFGNLQAKDAGTIGQKVAFYTATSCSVLSMYGFTYRCLTQLNDAWTRVIDARQRKMAEASDASTRAVLVCGSLQPRSTLRLLAQWAETYPGLVHGLCMVRDTGMLSAQLSKAVKMGAQIEALDEELVALRGMPLSDAFQAMSDASHAKRESRMAQVEAELEAKREAHAKLVAEAEEERALVDVPENDRGLSYVVLFRTASAANTARQVLNTMTTRGVRAAPAPHEVNWHVLIPRAALRTRVSRLMISVAFYTALLFYAVPINAVSSLMVLDDLERQSRALSLVLCWLGPTVRNLVAAFLPSLALIVFLAMLPAAMQFLARRRGDPDLAVVEVDAILNLWLFNFVWVLLGTPVVNAVMAGPTLEGIVQLFSRVSTFFILYLTLQASVSIPFGGLSRVPKIVVESFKKRAGTLAPNVTKPEPLAYDVVWAQSLLAAGVGLSFTVSSPAVLPFVLFHVTVSYSVHGRNLLYSLSRGWIAGKHDGGKGLMWAEASRWLLILLAVGQLMLAGLHLAQLQYATFGLLLLPPVATLVAHRHFAREFAPQLQLLPMNRCRKSDDAEAALGDLERSRRLEGLFLPGVYMQPELVASTWERVRRGTAPPSKPGDWEPPPSCMRVAVVGATGGIGRHVVRLALAAGHTVVALAREPDEVEPRRHRRLRKFAVDFQIAEAADVAPLLKGCRMVLSCLGNRAGEGRMVHRGTTTILSAMVSAGVPRMAMVSCVGVSESDQQLRRQGGIGWLFSLVFSTILSADRADLAAAETACMQVPRATDTTCVVVRAADLNDHVGTQDYVTASTDGDVGASIPREDVAHFLLSLLRCRDYDGRAVSLGGRLPPGTAATDAAAATLAAAAAREEAQRKEQELRALEEAAQRVPVLEQAVRQLEERLEQGQPPRGRYAKRGPKRLQKAPAIPPDGQQAEPTNGNSAVLSDASCIPLHVNSANATPGGKDAVSEETLSALGALPPPRAGAVHVERAE